MNSAVTILDMVIEVLRSAFLIAAVTLFVVFGIDWLVRTRRLNPFGRVARFFRRSVHPLVAPVERAVVRAGGVPSSAPWWALVAVVLGGIVVLVTLDFARGGLLALGASAQLGVRGIADIAISWIFGILVLALLIRVIAGWVRVSLYSRWLRWTVTLTEPILRPLRKFVPPVGPVDVTPVVAWILLQVVQWLLHQALWLGAR